MFRNGMKLLIEMEKVGNVIGEAENGKEFLELLETHKPDIVLMDIDMPIMNGIKATVEAIKRYPELKILALSMFGDEKHYAKMINAGVKGFVLKKSGKHELEKGIREVAKGESYFSNELLRNIIINIGEHKITKDVKTGLDFELNERELLVLKYISNGCSTSEIADKLYLSIKTIESYRSKLLAKTGSKNAVTLIIFAIKHGLIKI